MCQGEDVCAAGVALFVEGAEALFLTDEGEPQTALMVAPIVLHAKDVDTVFPIIVLSEVLPVHKLVVGGIVSSLFQ